MIGPGDPAYEDARAVYNAMIDRRPALIAQLRRRGRRRRRARATRARTTCSSPSAAAATTAPAWARATTASSSTSRRCKQVDVDPAARTVRVGGGCTWGEVDRATGEHGLATPSGIISTTGVGGLTLGGGLGHLTRKFGLAIDNLLEAEVVLADGRVVRASADEHPDLFWALRGGGGNFGVVTSFLFRLHEVGTVVGGPTFWPVEQGAEVLSAYREFLPSAPRELNGFFAFCSVPPAPPFPEELHLRKVCGVVWCYVGGEEDAAAAMAPFLDALPEPLLHGLGPMPHAALQSAFDGLYPTGRPVVLARGLRQRDPRRRGRRCTRASAPRCRRGSRRCTCTRSTARRTTSAAPTRRGAIATRRSTRSTPASIPTRPTCRAIRSWSVDYCEALHPYSAGGAYVNMMMDEGRERVRASYRDNYDRLARVKADYDPDNTFRVNQNIEPA